MKTERDPLIDPRPGDCVVAMHGDSRVIKARRTVVSVRGGIIVYQASNRTKSQCCWIATWRRWCWRNKAEVAKD